MPKVNVYLSDDLAEAVRESGVPVSAVCQKALSDAVRQIGRARKAVEALRDESFDVRKAPKLESRMALLMTPRLKGAIALADHAAGPERHIATSELLFGMLDEGANMGVRALESLGVDTEELRALVAGADPGESIQVTKEWPRENAAGDLPWDWLTNQARFALASMLEVSIELGHNYLGCEHLLLALTEEDTAAGRALESVGVNRSGAERAVRAALAGYSHARETSGATGAQAAEMLAQVSKRLDSIERRLRTAGI